MPTGTSPDTAEAAKQRNCFAESRETVADGTPELDEVRIGAMATRDEMILQIKMERADLFVRTEDATRIATSTHLTFQLLSGVNQAIRLLFENRSSPPTAAKAAVKEICRRCVVAGCLFDNADALSLG